MIDTPVVLIHGARQTGKSTLARAYAEDSARYVTMDHATNLSAATSDPEGFLSQFEGPVVLDEVQRVPDLLRAIKLAVDQDRKPGRFLLTGSANMMLLPNVSESLAGRMEILTLWPFSGSELAGNRQSFVDTLFGEGPISASVTDMPRRDLLARILVGGFPEAVARDSAHRRNAWFGSYVTTILQRDMRDLANIEHLSMLPLLLRLLATRSMTQMNVSELSRSLELPYMTLKRYIALLETTFLIQRIPPWSANLGKRLVKTPKVMLCDTGLMAHLLGVDSPDALPDHVAGALVENHAAMELVKHLGWSRTRANLFFFREQSGKEVDLVLEDAAGQVVGVEVKAAASVSSHDLRHLKFLRERLGSRFRRGVVFYTGNETVAFDAQLAAVPLAALTGS